MRNSLIYVNGTFTEQPTIDVEERGFQFGDGIYEVVAVKAGRLLFTRDHFNRLENSCAALRIQHGFTYQTFEKAMNELVEKTHCENGMVYIQVTRGTASRNHAFPSPTTVGCCYAYTMSNASSAHALQEGKAITLADIRWLRCDIKSLNLLGSVLAKQEASESGADEAILHREGIVTEGSSTNVFVVNDGILYTHPANHLILNGITRQYVIKLAKEAGHQVVEEPFSIQFLEQADEVFITSTTQRIRPITTLNAKKLTDAPGSLTSKLQQALQATILNELN
ncbi:D-amino-acid transaminase [Aureibacillus halotolerans]|uniref:D-alanine aminotransferase n=1 Tax=Aureibacillus halotolerans TaxID=1508390 RepID=A0A4R6U3S8_9BACI|nr:D-amino-acid transaminase [Aureibacillus halotolerans]TDQ40336.1 D-alanine aminotransferase [Aureibacillus halotolerans]